MSVINPYNPLGELHNSLLTNLITTNPSPTIEEAIDILADSWATQCDDSTPNFLIKSKMMAGQAYNTANFYISPGSVSYTLKDLIIAKSNFNGLQLDFLIRLLNSDNPPPGGYFETLQEDILNSPLTPEESSLLLAGCAIAIYSNTYWAAADANPLDPWYPYRANFDPFVDTITFVFWFFYLTNGNVDGLWSDDSKERRTSWRYFGIAAFYAASASAWGSLGI